MHDRNKAVSELVQEAKDTDVYTLFDKNTGTISRTPETRNDLPEAVWLYITAKWYPVFDKKGKYLGFNFYRPGEGHKFRPVE
jgi:hypothetical protein